jgi:hypothetical protein
MRWSVLWGLMAAPVLAQTVSPPTAPTPSGRGYSWLKFSDETAESESETLESARLARQPQPSEPTPAEPTDDSVANPSESTGGAAAPATEAPAAKPPICDKKKCEALAKAVAGSHKLLFYDNDFGYVLDPCYCDWWPGDHFKRRAIGDCLMVDVGGQYRMRYHNEQNFRGLGLTGRDDDFLLYRTRLFTNVEIGQDLRFYAEMIDAVSTYEKFPPRPIEENRTDVLNFFLDGTLWKDGSAKLMGRAGRQELSYGAQRLVSPLDWSDTRRTFDGGKLLWQGRDWNVDGFWVRPTVHDVTAFDKSNLDEQFYGLYSNYKGFENETVELYWLAYENNLAPFRYQTLGGRHASTYGQWLTEVEGGYQFGDNRDGSDHNAGFVTGGVGRKWDGGWKPQLWVYYDWASGTDDLGASNGFNHLFPLAHYFLGFMDLYGRQNIETPNVRLTLQPTERLQLLMWYYYFFLENKNDGPYSVAMTPYALVAPDSADLGHELDFTASYTINARTNLLLGYSHFFSGAYYNTPGLPFDGDADFYYTQLTFNF